MSLKLQPRFLIAISLFALIAEQHTSACAQDAGPSWPQIDQVFSRQEASQPAVDLFHLESEREPLTDSVLALEKTDRKEVVASLGPFRIVPHGRIVLDGIFSSAATTARPFVLYINDATPFPDSQVTFTGQSTTISLNVEGPDVNGFQSGGLVLFDFHGQRPVINDSGTFLIQAYAELKNERWRFAFGEQNMIIGPLAPTTVNWAAASNAGNIGDGNIRGQARAESYFYPLDFTKVILQLGLSQPVINDFVDVKDAIASDNGWPNIEGRLAFAPGRNGDTYPIEIGVSGLVGELRAVGAFANISTTWATMIDFRFEAELIGVRGEFWTGDALGTYGGGVGQSLNLLSGDAIRSTGGWLEGYYKIAPRLTAHLGAGIDDPRDADLSAGQRRRNEVLWGNLLWDWTDAWQFAFEISHWETGYVSPSNDNDAMVYQFRTQLSF